MKVLNMLALAAPAVFSASAVSIKGGPTVIEVSGNQMDIYPEELSKNDCAHLLWGVKKVSTASGKTATVSATCTEKSESKNEYDETKISCPLSGDGAGGSFDTVIAKYKSTAKISADIFGTEFTMSPDSLKINFVINWPNAESGAMTVQTEATFKSLPSSYDSQGLINWVMGECGASLSGVQEAVGSPDALMQKKEYSAGVMKSFTMDFVSKVTIDFPKAVTVDDSVVGFTSSGYKSENCDGKKKGDIPTAICFTFVIPRTGTVTVIDPPISAEPGMLSKGISLVTIIVLIVLAVVLLIAACVLCCYCCKCCKCCCCYGKCDYCLAMCKKKA